MRSIIFFILYFVFSPVGAQVTMRDVIRQMPDSLVPYLKQNARLDFIDFIDSGMKAEVSNELGGNSQLTVLTDSFASFELNAASQIQLRLLNVSQPVDGASQMVCMVRTFGTDLRESTIEFFSVKWQPLPAQQRISLPAYMHRIMLSAEAPELTIESEMGMDQPADEEQKVLSKTLRKLKWNNQVFKEY